MIILYGILAVLLVFVLILVSRAVYVKAKARKLMPYAEHETAEKQQYYAERLAKMIRCRTVSVEGSFEPEEFNKLNDVMKELFPEVHRRAEKKTFSDDCWIYRIEGKDSCRSIMLMSHHDVVKTNDENWDYDPFGGEIHKNALWGRGTVDTKTPLFAEFTALEDRKSVV